MLTQLHNYMCTVIYTKVNSVDEQREGWSALHCAAHRQYLSGIHMITTVVIIIFFIVIFIIVIFVIVKVTLLAKRMAKLSHSFSLSTFLFEQAQEQGSRPLAWSRGAQGFARQRGHGSDPSGCQGLRRGGGPHPRLRLQPHRLRGGHRRS